ncbi:Mannose-6-phosphate isomerase, cupin superfamily [Paraburkholderia fungorum]|uniref:Mannose-6-phosphate isomerase, cupin superfamily n=2 Tax=Paraburkholderia fungorum TaxID=134537 RepID=A0A1H1HEY9_9BURK|nr:Mannose-6-phosphate isomerase, cupin superfamily [Paraburkholderia fungorum]
MQYSDEFGGKGCSAGLAARATYNKGQPEHWSRKSASFSQAAKTGATVSSFQLPTAMKIIRSRSFTATHPWGALDIANMGGITTRLHWTDQPYKWHVNDGEEVFAVLDGRVEMRYRQDGVEQSAILETGDVFYASIGTEHVAHPIGAARVLVVESQGSV